jgi:hypothetical protein
MHDIGRIFLLLTVAALMVATSGVTAVPAAADVSPSKPGKTTGGGPPFTSGNVGNGGGGALVVHIGNETCVTHFEDFLPTNQTGGCD